MFSQLLFVLNCSIFCHFPASQREFVNQRGNPSFENGEQQPETVPIRRNHIRIDPNSNSYQQVVGKESITHHGSPGGPSVFFGSSNVPSINQQSKNTIQRYQYPSLFQIIPQPHPSGIVFNRPMSYQLQFSGLNVHETPVTSVNSSQSTFSPSTSKSSFPNPYLILNQEFSASVDLQTNSGHNQHQNDSITFETDLLQNESSLQTQASKLNGTTASTKPLPTLPTNAQVFNYSTTKRPSTKHPIVFDYLTVAPPMKNETLQKNSQTQNTEDQNYNGSRILSMNGNHSELSDSSKISRCLATPDIGECYGAFVRYYFRPELSQCDCYLYGGCPSKGENFPEPLLTIEECISTCRPTNKIPGPNCRGVLEPTTYFFDKEHVTTTNETNKNGDG